MRRRSFLRTTSVLPAVGLTGSFPLEHLIGTARPQEAPIAIDGLGEIRLDYEAELLDEIIGSGMRCCVVTAGNPGLYGAAAIIPETAAAGQPNRDAGVFEVLDRPVEAGTRRPE